MYSKGWRHRHEWVVGAVIFSEVLEAAYWRIHRKVVIFLELPELAGSRWVDAVFTQVSSVPPTWLNAALRVLSLDKVIFGPLRFGYVLFWGMSLWEATLLPVGLDVLVRFVLYRFLWLWEPILFLLHFNVFRVKHALGCIDAFEGHSRNLHLDVRFHANCWCSSSFFFMVVSSHVSDASVHTCKLFPRVEGLLWMIMQPLHALLLDPFDVHIALAYPLSQTVAVLPQ